MAQTANLVSSRTALLIMDVQRSIVARFPRDSEAFLARVGTVAEAARSAGITVIYVIVSFRAGYPEIGARNLAFSALKSSGQFIDDQVHEAVAPRPGEVVVVKRRVSAFAGSDLEVILRGKEIDHLILTGIATSGVVLSTLRQAADADYRLTVVSDCCLDGDAEVHAVLVGKVFPRQATVASAQELIALLASAGSG
jgi:nicotinamidase-related amidase